MVTPPAGRGAQTSSLVTPFISPKAPLGSGLVDRALAGVADNRDRVEVVFGQGCGESGRDLPLQSRARGVVCLGVLRFARGPRPLSVPHVRRSPPGCTPRPSAYRVRKADRQDPAA